MGEGLLRKFIGGVPDDPKFFDMKLNLLNAYPHIKQFDFGDMDRVGDNEWVWLQDFALELIQAKKFALPFDRVSYAYKAGGAEQVIIATSLDDGVIEILCGVYRGGGVAPVYGFLKLNESGPESGFACNVRNSILSKMIPDQAAHDDALITFSRAVCALTCMLKAHGVVVETTSVPVKLNEKRAKKGRLPIYEIRTVKIVVGGKAYSSGGECHSNRASPRLHWRRGHLRRLPSGAITVVQPCLVGDVGAGAVGHAGYSIRKAS